MFLDLFLVGSWVQMYFGSFGLVSIYILLISDDIIYTYISLCSSLCAFVGFYFLRWFCDKKEEMFQDMITWLLIFLFHTTFHGLCCFSVCRSRVSWFRYFVDIEYQPLGCLTGRALDARTLLETDTRRCLYYHFLPPIDDLRLTLLTLRGNYCSYDWGVLCVSHSDPPYCL